MVFSSRELSELHVVCLSVRSSLSFYIFYTSSSEFLTEFQQKLTQSMSSCMREIVKMKGYALFQGWML